MKRRPENHDWSSFRAVERPVEIYSPHAAHRLALVYANTYHVGMSSLGFQRVFHLVHERPEWCAERFFTDGSGMPLSVETGRPLNDFAAIAFSVSFEEDYLNLLALLDRAGIPLAPAGAAPVGPGGRARRLLRGHQPTPDE